MATNNDQPKDYLIAENDRNKKNRELYMAILAAAYPDEVSPALIAHHLTFSRPDADPNEIPSADTMIFDHDIMRRVFGEAVTVEPVVAPVPAPIPRYQAVILDCASVDCEQRDDMLRYWFGQLGPEV